MSENSFVRKDVHRFKIQQGRSDDLNILHASKFDDQSKRSPLKPINAIDKQKSVAEDSLSSKTINRRSLHQTISDENGLECNFARLYLLSLYNASKSSNAQNESSSKTTSPLTIDKSTTERANGPENMIKSNASLKIVDLNNYCLQRIVRILPLQDIINVAGSCKRLQAAACGIFQFLLREHEVVIDCTRYPRYTINTKSTELPQMFSGSDLVAFAAAFGKIITKLKVIHMNHVSMNDAQQMQINATIMNMLMTECVMNLRAITFLRCGEQMLKDDQRFEEVTKVTFEKCILGKNESHFQHFFPKMRKLELIDCSVRDVRDCIAMSFPLLKCLNLSVTLDANSWSKLSFTVENIKSAIDLNPQIQSIGLCYWNESAYDATLLQYAAVNLPYLKSLELWHLRYTDFSSHGPIQFANVHKFTLAHSYDEIGRLDRNLSALSFPKLHKFYINGCFDTECLTFLSRHKTIKKLSHSTNGQHNRYPSDDDIIKVGSILPNLEKIELYGKRLSPKGLLRFISQYKSVTVIKVRHYISTAPGRYMFETKCQDLGWTVKFSNSAAGPEFIMKRSSK